MRVAVTVTSAGEVSVQGDTSMTPDQTIMILNAGLELIRRKVIALEVDHLAQQRAAAAKRIIEMPGRG